MVSGHDPGELDFACLASAPGTLVVFMGLSTLGPISAGLIGRGKPPSTPAAIVSGGTTAGQRVVVAPLVAIADAADGLEPPALVVIGEVVALADRLALHELLGAAAA